MSAKMGKKAGGRQPQRVTVNKARRETVYKLPDGTAVTAERVTVSQRKYTPRARHCKVCGVEFKPDSKHARYCSQACRSKAYRQRKAADQADQPREIVVEHLGCDECGTGFFAVKGKGAKYCSGSCRSSAYKARRRAAAEALANDLGTSLDDALDALDARGLREIGAYLTSRGYLYDAQAHMFVLPLFGAQARVWSDVG